MKSSSLSHNMTASMEVFCIPCPCVTWLVHTKSSMAKAPRGDFELPLSTKKLEQLSLHKMLQEQNERVRHLTLEWIQDESWQYVHLLYAGHYLWMPSPWRRLWWGKRPQTPMSLQKHESSDEDRNSCKIQLPHMSLNHGILPRTSSNNKNWKKYCKELEMKQTEYK